MRRAVRIVALAVFALAPASAVWAQCVAFLVPPTIPIFRDEEGDAVWSSDRKDYTLVYPTLRTLWSPSGPLLKMDSSAPIPTRSPCLPDDFKRSKAGRLRVLMPRERDGSLFEVWITEKDSISVVYEPPIGSRVSGDIRLQSAAENLGAIRHAADLKLDKIRNLDFKPPEIQNQETFKADFDQTWSAMIETMSDQKWQIESIDKGSGLVTTKAAIDKRGETMVCATQLDQEHRSWLNVFVKKVEGGTRVKVNATFHAIREDQAINCYSSGTLERELFKGIQANLGPAPK
jgi:hypothetical protein